ncbi:MAG: hypothetical protein ACYTKD_01070 [Planctomycetota bacterium]
MRSDLGTVAALKGTNALVVPDTPGNLAAMEKFISEIDKPPKQVHFSMKLILLSDADARRVSAESLPDWRPGETRALGVLKTFDFTELQAFLQFVRKETRGSIMQLPQRIVLDREGAMIDLEEEWRRGQAFHASIGGKVAPGPGLKLGPASRVTVTPHVTGPDNDVILTVVIGAPKPEFTQSGMLEASGPAPRLPSTVSRVPVAKVKMRDRETAVVACGHGELRGEKVNVLVTITPTVIDFEKKANVDRDAERAREELRKGVVLEEDVVPPSASPEPGAADAR